MFVITERNTDIVQGIHEEMTRLSNNYPMDIKTHISYVPEFVNIYEDVEVSEKIEPYKYCYEAGKGFYENPNYAEPEQLYTLDEAAEILTQEVANEL